MQGECLVYPLLASASYEGTGRVDQRQVGEKSLQLSDGQGGNVCSLAKSSLGSQYSRVHPSSVLLGGPRWKKMPPSSGAPFGSPSWLVHMRNGTSTSVCMHGHRTTGSVEMRKTIPEDASATRMVVSR